jgi:streptogramin lyase
MYGPRGLAFRKDGSALVADTGNNRITVFDKDGVVAKTWGSKGSEPGQFMGPVGLALAPDGRVFVCDPGNGRLQILDSNGSFVRQIPLPGVRPEPMSEPRISFGPAGQAVCILPVTREIVRLDDRGILSPLATFPEMPMDACFSADGLRLLVVDVAGRFTWVDAVTGKPVP